MNSLTGVDHAGFNATDISARINKRFEAMDLDNSGSLTKAEIAEYRTARELDTSRIDKVFARLDLDGDELVSLNEYEDRLLAIAERRNGTPGQYAYEKLRGPFKPMSYDGSESFGALKALFESTDSPAANDEQTAQVRELSQRIEVDGFSENNLSALVSFLTSVMPPIDSKV